MTLKEYNEVVKDHADALFRFLMKNIRNSADAEDLAQVAFEKLWNNREKVEYKYAKAFLFRVGYNAMIDNYRKMRRINIPGTLPDKGQMPEGYNYELKEALEMGLNKLNQDQRSVLLLRDYEGYSYKEIAEITGLSESQVKVYIFRARKNMRDFLGSYHKIKVAKYGH